MTNRERNPPRDKTCECGKKFHDFSATNKRRTCSPPCARIRHDRQTQESKDRAKTLRGGKLKTVTKVYMRKYRGEPEWIDAICPRCRNPHHVDGRRFTKWTYCPRCDFVRDESDYTEKVARLSI